jgi:plastocyanin
MPPSPDLDSRPDTASPDWQGRLPAAVVVAAAAVLGVGAVIALANERDDGPAGPASSAGPASVAIRDFLFTPADLKVAVGDTVTWTNDDEYAHTVTSEDGDVLDSGNLDDGQTYELTFDQAGDYAYVCAIHPAMTATVTVEES